MVNYSGAWKYVNKLLSNQLVKIPTTTRNATKIETNVCVPSACLRLYWLLAQCAAPGQHIQLEKRQCQLLAKGQHRG